MANPDELDPIARLWLAALRAEVDALVLSFEAQLKQHVAATAGAHERARATLTERVAVLEGRLAEATLATQQADAENDHLRAEKASLEAQLRSLGERVESLDEQFAPERAFVAALLGVPDSGLFEAAEQVVAQPLEASPACYGALKARGLEVVLTQSVRERGRTSSRNVIEPAELGALRAMADAAGCRLLEVAIGTRFASSSMEKAGERSSPSEEGEVLECVMPGLRRTDAPGSLVFPRVVVAIG